MGLTRGTYLRKGKKEGGISYFPVLTTLCKYPFSPPTPTSLNLKSLMYKPHNYVCAGALSLISLRVGGCSRDPLVDDDTRHRAAPTLPNALGVTGTDLPTPAGEVQEAL